MEKEKRAAKEISKNLEKREVIETSGNPEKDAAKEISKNLEKRAVIETSENPEKDAAKEISKKQAILNLQKAQETLEAQVILEVLASQKSFLIKKISQQDVHLKKTMNKDQTRRLTRFSGKTLSLNA